MARLVKLMFVMIVGQLIALSWFLTPVTAHEVRPSIVDVNIASNRSFNLSIRLNLEAIIAEIGPEHDDTSKSKNATEYNRLRALSEPDLKTAFSLLNSDFASSIGIVVDGKKLGLKFAKIEIPQPGDTDLARTSTIRFSGTMPAGSKALTWHWPKKFGASVVRVKAETNKEKDGKAAFAALVKAGATSDEISLTKLVPPRRLSVFVQYIDIGIEHIIPKGLDHILFVVGLFLLSARFSSLLWQISSFTIAHTITLGLAMAGIISAPASFVEPLIALSIVYVAVENIFTGQLNRWRPVVVFLFGLLHGLGFASVLNDVGLQPTNFIAGLIGFNLGVEIGQLCVIAVCFLLVGFWFRNKPYYRKYITNPASLLIAIIATYWFIERTIL